MHPTAAPRGGVRTFNTAHDVITDRGSTALHMAAEKGQPGVCMALLARSDFTEMNAEVAALSKLAPHALGTSLGACGSRPAAGCSRRQRRQPRVREGHNGVAEAQNRVLQPLAPVVVPPGPPGPLR